MSCHLHNIDTMAQNCISLSMKILLTMLYIFGKILKYKLSMDYNLQQILSSSVKISLNAQFLRECKHILCLVHYKIMGATYIFTK